MSIFWVLNLLSLVVMVLMAFGIAALLCAIVWIIWHELRDIWGGDDE